MKHSHNLIVEVERRYSDGRIMLCYYCTVPKCNYKIHRWFKSDLPSNAYSPGLHIERESKRRFWEKNRENYNNYNK